MSEEQLRAAFDAYWSNGEGYPGLDADDVKGMSWRDFRAGAAAVGFGEPAKNASGEAEAIVPPELGGES
jgi:hypothetical protein